MCRNIRTLFNFEPPATDDEIRASAIQFVRKLSGATKPSKANQPVFDRAVDEIVETTRTLLASLVTTAPPKNRRVEAEKARARVERRFGRSSNG
ncbi:MAG: DUF2277 domain-containing protein [Gammaproteobacteria bacterium]|nr:DUF2277 domain-containing protein [Gammaproteobacteria bacterium]MDH3431788.1 DUF2277 domain-containing protein [Gammaproteobacteria bacterium]MDH3434312.1 DUF2277 domain-containing protein [Gammaproteobacteria bacterium]